METLEQVLDDIILLNTITKKHKKMQDQQRIKKIPVEIRKKSVVKAVKSREKYNRQKYKIKRL